MDVRFKTPANFYICGQSQSGKTSLVRSMLYNLEELFHPIPTQVIYCFGQAQKELNELIEIMPKIKLVEGFPDDLYDIVGGHTNSLIILDDLMCHCFNDQRMSDLFTCGSHHQGITVMYLTQNLFPPGKLSCTISLNSHYMIVFKNPRDSLGISTLARQMYPHNTNFLLKPFQDATAKPYGYLLLDLHQLTPDNMRLRTNILPGEKQIVYVKCST